MKRIVLTESQYNRLVKQPLNEQEIIFADGYNIKDVEYSHILNRLLFLSNILFYYYKENLYIKSIDDDKMTIDFEKYGDNEELKKFLIDRINFMFDWTDNPEDIIDSEGNVDFSIDTEPVDCETVVDDLSIRQKIITNAKSKLGQPYCHKTFDTDEGGDCSGLIDWVLRNTDSIDSPYNGRETSKVLKNLTKSSNKKKKTGLDKGDILVFNKMRGEKYGHVGFVYAVTDGKVDMIHSSGSKGVNISKDIFNNNFWSGNRYYGAIPIVDGKYESN
jgi:hypothetical protein